MYIYGGYAALSDVWEFDLNSFIWVQKISSTGVVREGSASIVYNNLLYIFGGATSGTDLTGTQSVYVYDPNNNTFTARTGGGGNRYGHAAGLFSGRIIIYGGYSNGYLGSAYAYDPEYDYWFSMTAGTARYHFGHTVPTYNGKLYVHGGTNGS